MKTELDHLPDGKRRELEFVVEMIRAGFAASLAHRMAERLRAGKLLKIILFGSYARGDWVVDPIGRYFSDFDLLVIVNHEDLTDVSEFWSKTEDRLVEEVSAGTKLRTPVSMFRRDLEMALPDLNDDLFEAAERREGRLEREKMRKVTVVDDQGRERVERRPETVTYGRIPHPDAFVGPPPGSRVGRAAAM